MLNGVIETLNDRTQFLWFRTSTLCDWPRILGSFSPPIRRQPNVTYPLHEFSRVWHHLRLYYQPPVPPHQGRRNDDPTLDRAEIEPSTSFVYFCHAPPKWLIWSLAEERRSVFIHQRGSDDLMSKPSMDQIRLLQKNSVYFYSQLGRRGAPLTRAGVRKH